MRNEGWKMGYKRQPIDTQFSNLKINRYATTKAHDLERSVETHRMCLISNNLSTSASEYCFEFIWSSISEMTHEISFRISWLAFDSKALSGYVQHASAILSSSLCTHTMRYVNVNHGNHCNRLH
jgi:hypothetical protein